MRNRAFALLALVVAGIAVVMVGGAVSARAEQPDPLGEFQERLLGGDAYTQLANPTTPSPKLKNYNAKKGDDCQQRRGTNVKVNQNCLNLADSDLQGRSQAQNETAIAIDPSNPKHMVAVSNDYRRGDGTCGSSYSADGGLTWSDSTVPNGFTRGDPFGKAREYWQAGGDPSVAFDTKGNAYYACQVFQRGAAVSPNVDLSSAFYVFRSTGNGGASWNFPGRPVVVAADPNGTGTVPFEDKEYLTVDNHVGSPFQDRIYVTWTEFTADGTAYIYEAYSNDYGESFSDPVLVSGDTALCSENFGLPTPRGNCNENQFSDPFVGPDGTLYVAWANFNNTVTGNDNRNQLLLARSVDGGQSFTVPVKVSDYYDVPDCATYQDGQDAGRGCVPEKGSNQYSVFRVANLPSGAVDPTNASRVVVAFGSYINQHSNESNGCVPQGFAATGLNTYTGVKTAGACNNDIVISVSNDGGANFSGAVTDPRLEPVATQDPRQAKTDQWWQWAAYTKGGSFVTSYYDRQYGDDETSAFMDFSVSASKNVNTFTTQRATSSSMPPPTQFTDAQGNGLFFGDYTGLAAWNQAFPVWMDTRATDLFLCPGTGAPGSPPQTCAGAEPNGLTANDQDIYTTSVAISGG